MAKAFMLCVTLNGLRQHDAGDKIHDLAAETGCVVQKHWAFTQKCVLHIQANTSFLAELDALASRMKIRYQVEMTWKETDNG